MKYFYILLMISSVTSFILHSIPACCKTRSILNSRSLHQYNNINSDEKEAITANADHISNPATSVESSDIQKLLTSIALISGTTIGAGILALASVSQKPGFIPSSISLIVSWILMASTGLLIAEITCNIRKFNIQPTNTDRNTILYEDNVDIVINTNNNAEDDYGLLEMTTQLLGQYGAWPTGLIYMFIHYSLLIAYIAEAGDIIHQTTTSIPNTWGSVLFTSIMGGSIALGSKAFVDTMNNVFFIIVIITFLALVFITGGYSMNVNNLLYQDYSSVAPIIPILLVALVFHNIVPTVCIQLDYNSASIKKAIILGSFIPLCMFLLWNAVILGSIPNYPETMLQSGILVDPLELLRSNIPSNSKVIIEGVISLFSISAIITSFIGFVIGLMEFYCDLNPSRTRKDLLLYGLVLIPPLIIALIDPSIFLNALDAAGTFGISLLFGILPAILALVLRNKAFHKSSVDTLDDLELATVRNNVIDSTLVVAVEKPVEGEVDMRISDDNNYYINDDASADDNSNIKQTDSTDTRLISSSSNRAKSLPASSSPTNTMNNNSNIIINNNNINYAISSISKEYIKFIPGCDVSLYLIISLIIAIIIEKIIYIS